MDLYWLVLMDRDHFLHAVSYGVFGVPIDQARVRGFIKPYFRLVAVMVDKRCGAVCGSQAAVAEVTHRWTESQGPYWPDEIAAGRVKYPWMVRARVLTTGEVDLSHLRCLYPKLELLLNAYRDGGYGIYFDDEALPQCIGELIETRLISNPLPAATYDEVVKAAAAMGELLGFNVARKHLVGLHRVDLAFLTGDGRLAAAVQVSMRDRSVIADLNALRDAAENSDAALVYVLTRYDVETLATLRELLEGRYRDLANRVTVVEAAQLIKLYQLLQSLSVRELLSKLFKALVDVNAQGGVVGDQS